MEKILVTTDFSTNSKAGIRFAIQLASQTNRALIFYNVIELLKPTVWSILKWENYATDEIDKHQKKLQKFIQAIYKASNLEAPNFECVCEVETAIDAQIISYAKKVKASYICMSTKGAGNIQKLFGTNASALITSSPIPVVVVPYTYKIKPITSIWYASDFENLKMELTAVNRFNQDLQAQLIVNHYYMLNIPENDKKTASIIAKNQSDKILFNSKKRNIDFSLVAEIQIDVKKAKPSLLVLFTKQNRSWFERLFLSSKTAELAFDLKTPMLVFRKK